MPNAIELMNTVLRLEGDRTVAICALGQGTDADARITLATSQMLEAVEAMQVARVQYPLHMLASASGLSQEDYLLLQLAVLTQLGEDRVLEATRFLGAESPFVRLSHAATLFARLGIKVAGGITALKPITENLVIAIASDDGLADPILAVGPAVRELMGW